MLPSAVLASPGQRSLVLLILLHLCAGIALAQATGTLSGVVVDGETHRGIARVLVESPANGPGQLTDTSGRFSFPDIPLGTVQVRYHRPGYFDPLSGETSATRALTLAADTTEQTLTLDPTASLRGHIVAPDGYSAAGIRVDLYAAHVVQGWRRWRIAHSLPVRADGSFLFANLQPGSYALHVQGSVDPVPSGTPPGIRSGYASVFAPDASDLASASVYVLRPGEIADADLNLSRVAYYPVSIHVAGDVSGFGAQITGNGFTRWTPHYSREDQDFTTELPSGSYLLQMGGFAHFGGGSPATVGNMPFRVDGAPVSNLSMTLSTPGSMLLETQVDTDTGANSPAASSPRVIFVLLVPADAPILQEITAFVRHNEATGPESLNTTLNPGRYWVSATASGGYVASLSSGGTNLFTQPLTIEPGSPPTISAVLRTDTAGISVTLASPLNQEPCVVQLIPLSPGGNADLRTASTASTTENFTSVVPGDYLVIATAARASIAYREPGVLQQLTGVRVTATPGGTAQATLNSLSAPPASTTESH